MDISTQTKRNIDLLYLVTRSDTVGGVHVHIIDLCKKLIQDGYKVSVITGISSDSPFLYRLENERINYNICSSLVREIDIINDIKSLFYIINYIYKNKPKLVSLHSSKIGILGRIACFITRTKCIFTAHGWSFNSNPSSFTSKLYTVLEYITQFIPTKIITVSNYDLITGIKRGINRNKVITIHNSVPFLNTEHDSLELEANQIESRKIRLLSVARLDSQKDHKSLFFALSDLDRKLDWQLDLLGSGPYLGQLSELSRKLNIDNRVNFHGHISNTIPFYRSSDIFILMSHWEGFPRSTIEALRASLPVIVSNVGGSSEAVIDSINGFIIPESDSKYLCHCLTKLIEDDDLRERMSKVSFELFKKNFSYSIFYSKMLALYKPFIKL